LRQRLLYSIVFVLVAVAGIASAQSPEWRYGGRISWVNAGTSSDELGDTGSTLDLRSGLGVEFDATLMFSDLFGVELSVGASTHQLQVSGGDPGTIDAGRLWLVPLAAIAQYHHPVYGPWDPYVGLGITWAAPFFKKSGDASDAGIEEIEFEGGPAFAAQIGVNYQVDNRWYANIDLRYSGTSVDAQVRTDEGDLPTVKLDIKPLVVSLGFGYKF
jgi:outer membrane protein